MPSAADQQARAVAGAAAVSVPTLSEPLLAVPPLPLDAVNKDRPDATSCEENDDTPKARPTRKLQKTYTNSPRSPRRSADNEQKNPKAKAKASASSSPS